MQGEGQGRGEIARDAPGTLSAHRLAGLLSDRWRLLAADLPARRARRVFRAFGNRMETGTEISSVSVIFGVFRGPGNDKFSGCFSVVFGHRKQVRWFPRREISGK